AVG
ncbi:hypothetical protein MK372_05345, partial [Streptococcus oralis]